MKDYLMAVTLGAFTWKNKERINMLFDQIKKTGTVWLLLHFLLLVFCLNFPVTFILTRLSPFELYGRLYGENTVEQIVGKFCKRRIYPALNKGRIRKKYPFAPVGHKFWSNPCHSGCVLPVSRIFS